MAIYQDEEQVWKCQKHPSKRRRITGICPICLRDRLVTLCPECANVRPCACYAAGTTSSSSSSSSSFSLFSSSSGGDSVGRVSSLIDSEPAFRRSRSLAIPFLRSRFAGDEAKSVPSSNRSRTSFLSVFKRDNNKTNKQDSSEEESKKGALIEEDLASVMLRSRSVCVPAASESSRRSSSGKGKSWYFPSPMKVFRHSKIPKVSQERSPLYRG